MTVKSTILVFSSNQEIDNLLVNTLVELGYSVENAKSEDTVLSQVIKLEPDLIICDKNAGDKSGFQIFQFIHHQLKFRSIPFVLSGKNFNRNEILLGQELGIDAFLFSPFDSERVQNILQNILIKNRRNESKENPVCLQLMKILPYPVILLDGKKIIKGNQNFYRQFAINASKSYLLQDLFNFEVDEAAELKYLRFINGLNSEAIFEKIDSKTREQKRYDLYMFSLGETFQSNCACGIIIQGTPVSKELIDTKQINTGIGTEPQLNGTHSSEFSSLLSDREKEIFSLSVKGTPIKQIADKLGISARTVEKHRSNIIHKTSTGNMMEAIYSIRNISKSIK